MTAAGRSLIGCSGWLYRDWRGRVYPPDLSQAQWFEWYSHRLPTVEINNTFYRLPDARTVERGVERAPREFWFAVKLGGFGTHRKKLRDPATWLPNHLDRFETMAPCLAATFVQLPPRWRRDVARLEEFLALLPPDSRWALEVRDPSWLHDDVFEALAQHGVALCLHDLIQSHPILLTTDWTYLRFHGPDATRRPYHGAYGHRRLARYAAWIAECTSRGRDVYGYFNNDYDGAAFTDARWLQRQLLTG